MRGTAGIVLPLLPLLLWSVVVKVQAIVVAVVAELVSLVRDGREECLSRLCLPEIEVRWKEL